MGRGVLTVKTNKIAQAKIGRKITKDELRLIVYLQYVMCNEQRLDRDKIREEENDILSKWIDEKFITGGVGSQGVTVTKKFWDFMCEIIFEAYVNYEK